MSPQPPPGIAAKRSPPAARRNGAQDRESWTDATALFSTARSQMEVGEMLHSASFSLFASMSAIELMDPKMDIGCGSFRDISAVTLPHDLTDSQTIAILDRLFASELAWMHAHTLPQTVFACLYHQRLQDARRPDFLCFMRMQLGTMRLVHAIIQGEHVAEEEDFITWTYGFRLPPMTEAKADLTWSEMSTYFASMEPAVDEEGRLRHAAILDRLKFRCLFYRLVTVFFSPSGARDSEVPDILSELQSLLKRIRKSSSLSGDCADLLSNVFDASVNRHLLTNTPPRTAAVFTVDEGFDALRAQLDEFGALHALTSLVLPRGPPPGVVRGTPSQQYSFHNALHALSLFSALHIPSILTRSLLKHVLLNGDTLCNAPAADVASMLLTDTGGELDATTPAVRAQAEGLAPFAEHFFWSLCRNRGRQRRHLVKALATWDQAVDLCFRKPTLPETKGDGAEGGEGAAEGEEDVYCGKSALELVAHEVSARMLVQHWLLGFECRLYQPYEYAPVFFYVGYALSALQNATASLAGSNAQPSPSPAGSGTGGLHASRFALYLLDEGRLWLCRALYSFLDALRAGELWDAPLAAPPALGRAGLRYEQRFGFTRAHRSGPAYVDHETFQSLMRLQEESLREKAGSDDAVIARLEDAATSFLTARRTLERAKKASSFYGWDAVTDEIQDLARVAVVNAVEVSQQRRTYPVWLEARKYGVGIKRSAVSFDFGTHRHFPVISVEQGI